MDHIALLYLAQQIERHNEALARLALCFDVWLDFTQNGQPATLYMDAEKATLQLENAIRATIGLPENAQ